MIERMVCGNATTLIEALKIINENERGSVFVIDEKNRLVGVLTDGDVRRFLLAGGGLERRVDEMMQRHFVYSHVSETYQNNLKKNKRDNKNHPYC